MTTTQTRRAGTAAAALNAATAPVRGLWNLLLLASERRAETQRRRIEDLNNLTDPELARMGLRRDGIVRHVFQGSSWY